MPATDHRDPLFDVAGRRGLIAGAAGGLGAPIASALAQRGTLLMLADIDAQAAVSLARKLDADGRIHACGLNVADEKSCAAVVDETVQRLGGIDVFINASGVYRTASAIDFTRRDWDLTIAVNLTGAFQLAQAVGRRMLAQRSGRIITIASVSSTVVNPDYAAYAASKAGVAQLTRVLAREWAAHGITVNAIGPAVTPTRLSQPILEDAATRAAALAKIPMGRFGTPEDLVGVVLLLSSAAGAFITGQTIYVDGGRTIA